MNLLTPAAVGLLQLKPDSAGCWITYVEITTLPGLMGKTKRLRRTPKNGQRGFGIYLRMLNAQPLLNLTGWQRQPLFLCLMRLILSYLETVKASLAAVNMP